MVPLSYLGFYVVALVGFVVATLVGSVYFYFGLGHNSYVVAEGFSRILYYLDKPQYDIQLSGLVYCVTFCIAGALVLAVIVIPSTDQILQRTQAAAPYAGGIMKPGYKASPPVGTPQMPSMMPPMSGMPPGLGGPITMKAPEILVEEDFEDYINTETALSQESDVVYGTGRITDQSMADYVKKYPDSALKFVLRTSLKGGRLPENEELIYQAWQKRGMSRSKIRDIINQTMEWEDLPDLSLIELKSQLRDRIFELSHAA